MKSPKFSLRDLCWLLLAAALGLGWWRSYWLLSTDVARLQEKAEKEERLAMQFGHANASLQRAIADAEFDLQNDPGPKLIRAAVAEEDSHPPPEPAAVVPTFQITRTRQRAVFYAGLWVGDAGHPVHTHLPTGGRPTLALESQRILLDHDAREWLEERAGPRPDNHTLTLLVDADIHLESETGEQPTDPPTVVPFYSVKIDKLHSVKWQRE
jgi:hypothetical protein